MAIQRKMLPPRRVKILESKYVEESDLIKWMLHFQDNGIEQVYVWPSTDLLKALNIYRTEITPKMLHKFCADMKGKEINFVIDKEPELPEVAITPEQDGELWKGVSEQFEAFKNKVEEDK